MLSSSQSSLTQQHTRARQHNSSSSGSPHNSKTANIHAARSSSSTISVVITSNMHSDGRVQLAVHDCTAKLLSTTHHALQQTDGSVGGPASRNAHINNRQHRHNSVRNSAATVTPHKTFTTLLLQLVTVHSMPGHTPTCRRRCM